VNLLFNFFTDPDLQLNQGYYHCEVKNDFGHAKSEIIHVSPKSPEIDKGMKPPRFKKNGKPEVEIQEIGKTVLFHCRATGYPKPDIVWTHNGDKLLGKESQMLSYVPLWTTGSFHLVQFHLVRSLV